MDKLKKLLKELNIGCDEIAKTLGFESNEKVGEKLENRDEFTVREAIILRDLIQKKSSKRYSIEELFSE